MLDMNHAFRPPQNGMPATSRGQAPRSRGACPLLASVPRLVNQEQERQESLEHTDAGTRQRLEQAVAAYAKAEADVRASRAVIAAQLWESLRTHLPEVEQQIARGEFGGLFSWLREHVHGRGAKVTVNELMKDATEQPLSANALLRYLETKYLEGAV